MPKKAVILLEGTRMGTGQRYVQAVKRSGLHPIVLSADPARFNYLATENIEAIRVDTDDLDALIRECSRLRETYDIVGITGHPNPGEAVYATVAKLCRHFGLPGPNPASIDQCCDKFTQRQLLAEAGVPVPAYRMATNGAEVESAAAEIGLPVILKPAAGNGSTGVRLCRDAEELAEHTVYLLGGTYEWQTSPRILVEEFAQGPYFIADIMGNRVIEIGAGKFGPPPHFVYLEYTYPAPLTDDQRTRITDVSLSCLRVLDLNWGPTNIEFRWTERGPVVIEVNPRLAGSPDPQLIQLACGVDLITEHIKLVVGDECDLRKRHSQTATARFLVPDRDGTLDWIDGASQAADVPGVAEVKWYVKQKAPLIRRGDARDCIGHIIAASPTPTQTSAILQRALASITWSITPFPTIDE
ncbi:ATP-grasp domain-containing protein [Sinorhizobium meliloti]|uniref:ATP-grasp domain-containing protein n=1 Tax=Rhizobium meliloti TaxID=382 RepID=UPI00299CDAEB|nr:ATP-grasp domain-containing protein [Sinorhizobium meliloti]MDW9527028.1 ATP-grasp domain-containing protein [Sinorhizobium meliloti]MDW9657910.1 ATP-grasp domain-containing protein [Sinorhizobium meliloti]MDW9880799.1 ATP-grasp domain-containing protein [Sinorhizobium meliloti]MDW9917899.1 ATP-grasp domain-containing protein [Sinorhizobium meliloti]